MKMANNFQSVRNSLHWIFRKCFTYRRTSHHSWDVVSSHQREREASSQKSSPHISRVNFPHLEKPFKTVFDSGRRSTQPQEWIKLQKIKRKSIPVFAPTLLSTPTPVFASTPLSTYNPPGEPWMAYGTRRRCSERSVSPLQLFAAPLAPHHHHQTSRPSSCPGSA